MAVLVFVTVADVFLIISLYRQSIALLLSVGIHDKVAVILFLSFQTMFFL